jgi:hypothetical protein
MIFRTSFAWQTRPMTTAKLTYVNTPTLKLTPNVELRSLCQPCWLAYFLIVLCHDFNHRKLIFKR